MKIHNLKVSHFKGARNVEIYNANGVCVEVAGPNGAGKTSVLDAIVAALAGKRAIQARPLTDGEEHGEIVLELDNGIRVIRRFREGGDTRLEVKANGKKAGQRELDSIFTDLTFDPLAFTRMKPAEQVSTLQWLAGGEWLDKRSKIEADLDASIDERRDVNRDLKRMGQLERVEPCEAVDASAVIAELKEAEKRNAILRSKLELITNAADHIAAVGIALSQLGVDDDKFSRASLGLLDLIPEKPKPIDLDPLRQKLNDAGRINAQAEAYKAYQAKLAEQQALSKTSNALDAKIDQLREQLKAHAKSANLPVDGLAFSDGGLRVNGLPFDQLSSSEQIRISARISAAMAGELKIMLVKDGSLLDDDSFSELLRVAKDTGVQLWVESVGTGHGDAIHLEAGQVVERKARAF